MNQEELNQWLVELLDQAFLESDDNFGRPCTEQVAAYLIKNGVTIRERGEWEWFEEWSPSTPEYPREIENCGWRCGKCKTALEDSVGGYWDDYYRKPTIVFCSHCGADMRGMTEQSEAEKGSAE